MLKDQIIISDAGTLQAVSSALGGAVQVVSIEDWMSSHSGRLGGGLALPQEATRYSASESAFGAVLGRGAVKGGLSRHAQSLLAQLHIPVLEVDADRVEPQPLYAWMLSVLAERLRLSRVDATQERGKSAALRSDMMRLQDSYSDFEAHFQALGSPTFSGALYFPRGLGEVSLKAEPSEAAGSKRPRGRLEITQPLPVPCRGLAGVELYVERVPKGAESTVSVELGDPERGGARVEIRWREFTPGWNQIYFPRACTEEWVRGTLTIRTDLQPGDSAALGLGAPDSLGRFHLHTNGVCLPGSTLALRLWRGIPGAVVPRIAGSLSRNLKGERSTLLMPSQCPRPEIDNVPEESESYVHTDYWGKENAVLVHGTVKGPVSAVLRDMELKDLVRVTASVNSMHREGPPLSYSIRLVPSAREDAELPDATWAWTSLLPGEWGEAHCFLEAPFTGRADFLLTVMVANSARRSNWAWGLFRGFRLYSEGSGREPR